MTLLKYNAQGNLTWETELPIATVLLRSPTLLAADGVIYVAATGASNNVLASLDASTGSLNWQVLLYSTSYAPFLATSKALGVVVVNDYS
jgi:outer membrane protein assembly factor BamB